MARMDARTMKRQVGAAFEGFTTGQKAMMAVATVAVVIGVFVFARSGSGPSMVPLFGGLSAEDASSIAGELDGRGVAYELADSGRTVLVPSGEVYRLRVDMAASGLPTGGSEGYSLLDGQGLTTNQFKQRIDYQRALQGELGRTIEAMDGVTTARVTLVVPTDDVFAADRTRSSASVLVDTGEQRLSGSQTRAIVNLVASAVPGLTPESVTVADQRGRALWTPDGEGGAATGGDERNERTASYERRIAEEIEAMLVPVIGLDNATVKVTADLDFDQSVQQSVVHQAPQVTGETPLIESQTRSGETYAGAPAVITGPLGVDGQPTQTEGTGTNYESSSEQTDYAVNTITEEVRRAGGEVRRLNVAAVVNADVVTEEQLAQITEIVATAAGIDADRGDQVTVQRLAFDTTAADEAEEALAAQAAASGQSSMLGLVQSVLVLVLVLVVVFLAWRSIRKATKRAEAEVIDKRELEAVREQLNLMLVPAGELPEGAAGALPQGERDVELSAIHVSDAALAAAKMERELEELFDKNPEQVAAVVRGWVSERRVAAMR